jgi:hypothetical protein
MTAIGMGPARIERAALGLKIPCSALAISGEGEQEASGPIPRCDTRVSIKGRLPSADARTKAPVDICLSTWFCARFSRCQTATVRASRPRKGDSPLGASVRNNLPAMCEISIARQGTRMLRSSGDRRCFPSASGPSSADPLARPQGSGGSLAHRSDSAHSRRHTHARSRSWLSTPEAGIDRRWDLQSAYCASGRSNK